MDPSRCSSEISVTSVSCQDASDLLGAIDTPQDCLELGDLFCAASLLDEDAYAETLLLPHPGAALEHYLAAGWRVGLEPSTKFDGNFLNPYFRSVGYEGPPALTYLLLRSAGWPVFPTREEIEQIACVLRASKLFDPQCYVAQFHDFDEELDPVLHYLLVGERLGYRPSGDFDPRYYAECYQDVIEIPNLSLLHHFVRWGRSEGRQGVSAASRLLFDTSKLKDCRTVLLINHEASRSGAPILGLNVARRLSKTNNVVALLLHGGDLVDDFRSCCAAVIGPLERSRWNEAEARYLARRLSETYDISYAIANSIECGTFVPAIADTFVPVITLVHEFASYTRPKERMTRALNSSSEIVFSTEMTATSAGIAHPILTKRNLIIMPQGRCDLPTADVGHAPLGAAEKLKSFISSARSEGAFLVLGCGFVHLRKGVDFFLACAAAARGLLPEKQIRFLWIGDGYKPDSDLSYSCYLAEQMDRSGLADLVTIVGAVCDLTPAYQACDVVFLSSRLDPFPNISIDAASMGKPIVCFKGASGIAELLLKDPVTAPLVVPYLDSRAAAEVILKLATDVAFRDRVSAAIKKLAKTTFDMDRYVDRLDVLGQNASKTMVQRRQDFATIGDDVLFDQCVCAPKASFFATREDAIRAFVNGWAAVGTSPGAGQISEFRRPCAGFHPQIYADANIAPSEQRTINPLAHFIRSGKPAGPWLHDPITPSSGYKPASPEGLRTAIHLHLYYPALLADFLDKLGTNQILCDLLLTTDTPEKVEIIKKETQGYAQGSVRILSVPNRGRDFGAFLTRLGAQTLTEYDVVGHFHSKRSVSTNDLMGDAWREFLWQHLVGGVYPLADVIMDRFARDPTVGLVFANDPHLPDWDANRAIASELTVRMGIQDPLPKFFEFPVGTMFWARPNALKPLFDLNLTWEDYPKEPLPYDGTILHALERLLPLAVKHAGFGFVTTHVPGITW